MTDDIFQEKPMPMPETDGKAALLAGIEEYAATIPEDDLQFWYNLSDDEFNQPEIQNALRRGRIRIMMESSKAQVSLMRDGNRQAAKDLYEISGGKQALKKYKMDYTSKDEAMLQHAEEIAKNSTIAQLAE